MRRATARKTAEFHGLVVVITGASSGIGRATAAEFAKRGASVVLAARRADALGEVARECEALGGRALPVPTDIAVPEQVDQLARLAVERFGAIDVWINNAAVLAMGRFEDVPAETFRRVMETNFFGRVYGTRAALKHFRARGRGIIIDVNSVLGRLAQPYASSYVASKFASRGFSDCLRQELLDTPSIRICSVFASPVDTPIYRHAANFLRHRISPIWPLYDATPVVNRILELVRRPRRELFAGHAGSLISAAHTLAPALMDKVIRVAVDVMQIRAAPAESTAGNVMHSTSPRDEVSGGWRLQRTLSSPWLLAGLIVGASLGVAAVSKRGGRAQAS